MRRRAASADDAARFQVFAKGATGYPSPLAFSCHQRGTRIPAYTHAHIVSCTRVASIWRYTHQECRFLCSSLFLFLLSLSPPSLFTSSSFSLSLEKRRRLYHRSFASRYTLVMGHFERGRNCSRFIWRALESTEEVQVYRADNRLNATQRSIKRRPVFRARQYEGELAGGWFGGVQFVNDRCQGGMAINYGVMRLKWIETGALLFFRNATFPSLNF